MTSADTALDFSMRTILVSGQQSSPPQLPTSTSVMGDETNVASSDRLLLHHSAASLLLPSTTTSSSSSMDLSTALAILRSPLSAAYQQQQAAYLAGTSSSLVDIAKRHRALSKSPQSIVSSQPNSESLSPCSPLTQQHHSQRKLPAPIPDEKKDCAYWERRRKNNDAAKRSRDSRRQKEEQIAMRAALLEQENIQLRSQVAVLKNETAKLHLLLFSNAQRAAVAAMHHLDSK